MFYIVRYHRPIFLLSISVSDCCSISLNVSGIDWKRTVRFVHSPCYRFTLDKCPSNCVICAGHAEQPVLCISHKSDLRSANAISGKLWPRKRSCSGLFSIRSSNVVICVIYFLIVIYNYYFNIITTIIWYYSYYNISLFRGPVSNYINRALFS